MLCDVRSPLERRRRREAVKMTRTANLAATVAAVTWLAMPNGASSGVPARGASAAAMLVPVASSNAHRPGIGGAYGGYKGAGGGLKGGRDLSDSGAGPPPLPYGSTIGRKDRIKPPYPYQYYDDTKRGNYGCHWMARRAIDTNNRNWLARYRACTEVGGD
jgi:hypothetical protein